MRGLRHAARRGISERRRCLIGETHVARECLGELAELAEVLADLNVGAVQKHAEDGLSSTCILDHLVGEEDVVGSGWIVSAVLCTVGGRGLANGVFEEEDNTVDRTKDVSTQGTPNARE